MKTKMTSAQIVALNEMVNQTGKKLGRLSNFDETVKRFRRMVVNEQQLMDLDTFKDMIDGEYTRAVETISFFASKTSTEVNEADMSVAGQESNQETIMSDTETQSIVQAEGEKPAKKTKAPKTPKEPKAEGAGPRGRVSKYAGKVLAAQVEANPRKAGSFGQRSLQIIMDNPGIKYEDYIAKGGRPNDLEWDIKHGSVVAADATAVAGDAA